MEAKHIRQYNCNSTTHKKGGLVGRPNMAIEKPTRCCITNE